MPDIDANYIEEMRERIISEDYMEILIPYYTSAKVFLEENANLYPLILNNQYAVIHTPVVTENPMGLLATMSYTSFPKIYTLLDTTSLEATGITRAHNQPILNLTGNNVIIGFIDTGIEYTHKAFRNVDGTSRIDVIWDQTIQTGKVPANYYYGTEYTREQINEALASDAPLSIVPSTDTNGHGTFIAGVAAGSVDGANDFSGAAPGATIAMVKIKPAKQYLKDFFLIDGDAPAYSGDDLVWAIKYLNNFAASQNKPLVLCFGLGTNQGDHSGNSPIEQILANFVSSINNNAIIAAGNEAGSSHHYYGNIPGEDQYDDVELIVGSPNRSFTLELWGDAPELYTVAIRSPTGEEIQRIVPRLQESQVITFTLDPTVIYVDYKVVEERSGSEVIVMRFQSVTPGVWNFRVYCVNYINGIFNMWLPITGLVAPDIVFLRPNPDITLTAPSTSEPIMTVSTYNAYDGSLFINSSRGYTRVGYIKPEIAAPGVNVYGPGLHNQYTRRTGSSVAAAITAGAVALIVNWGLTSASSHLYSSREIKNLIIRGATRSATRLYPNREWGYGTLNVFRIFESLR